jgi:hypothetical protein
MNPRSRFLDELPREDIRDIATATPRTPSYGGGGLSWGSTGHGSSKYGASAWGSPPADDARPWSHPQAGRDAHAHSAPAARGAGSSSRQTSFGSPSFGASSFGGPGSPAGRSAPPGADTRGGSYVDRSEADTHADEGVTFRVGMAVAHAKYGVGKVQAVGGGMPPKVTVAFPGWGVKQIVASFLGPA